MCWRYDRHIFQSCADGGPCTGHSNRLLLPSGRRPSLTSFSRADPSAEEISEMEMTCKNILQRFNVAKSLSEAFLDWKVHKVSVLSAR
jgi:hypothetical protein